MQDTSHLAALHTNLYNEKARLAAATKPQEIALRSAWVAQLEKEVASEIAFLGMSESAADFDISDNELAAALAA
jgi:hypothetical protein